MKFNRIVKNIFSLSVAEFLNKFFVFIYTAYLARTILTEGLGSINLAQSIATYLILVVTTGLDIYGIKELSRNLGKIKSLVNTLFSLRLILSFLAYTILILVVLLLNKEIELSHIVLIFGLTIFAQVNFLNWVFMALEKMEVIAVRLSITSAINLAGIFIFVRSPDDTWLAALVIAVSQIINAGWMLAYYFKKYYPIKFTFNLNDYIYHVKRALPMGMTFITIAFYNNIGIILVGAIVASNYLYQTGILGAALKLVLIAIVPIAIFQQAFFPRLAKLNTQIERADLLNKFTRLTFITGSFLTVIFFLYSDIIINLVFGPAFTESTKILLILAPVLIVMYANTSFFTPLIAWGYEKLVFKLVLVAAIVNLTINLIFIPIYGMYAVTIATIACELIVFAGLTFILRKAVSKTYFKNLFLIFLISAFSFALPYYLIPIHWSLNILIGLIVYILAIFLFKQLDPELIKSSLIKSNKNENHTKTA